MTKLNFTQLVQEKSLWCWAASGLSIARFLGRDMNVSQSGFIGATALLPLGTLAVPNEIGFLRAVQLSWKNLGLLPGTGDVGPLDFDSIKEEIDANRPIIAELAWATGGGHDVVIYGYDADETVHYSDPWPASPRYQSRSYDEFVSNEEFRWTAYVYQIGLASGEDSWQGRGLGTGAGQEPDSAQG
ncbi:papain-like cysteine protease family protein [Kitasatospora sp. NPDC057904]|uniref:papain-like cysteine protease family protein n=1 Tax=unclassified Kitasatospora TaxID=2633591 RepID=UPI0036DE3E16